MWFFNIDKLKSNEWNPAEYNVSGAFAEILNGKYDTLEVRLHSKHKIKYSSCLLWSSKKNIQNPTIEHTALAIAQNLGGIAVFEQDLNSALSKVN
jgi:hypothetical protein